MSLPWNAFGDLLSAINQFLVRSICEIDLQKYVGQRLLEKSKFWFQENNGVLKKKESNVYKYIYTIRNSIRFVLLIFSLLDGRRFGGRPTG